MNLVSELKCFVASPSDTKSEREACSTVVDELNRTICRNLNAQVSLLTWERDTWPSMGKNAQDVINGQIGSDYDVLIAIFANRFGTPTANYGSGTEEEIRLALDRYEAHDDIQLFFFFNNELCDPTSIVPEQLQKVRELKTEVADKGAYYWEFNGTENFREKLRQALTNELHTRLKNGRSMNDAAHESPNVGNPVDTYSQIIDQRLQEALKLYSDQPTSWVEPIIQTKAPDPASMQGDVSSRVSLETIVTSTDSYLISSPPQFGLTCLAHKLAKIAWQNGDFWPYISATKAHNRQAKKLIRAELKLADLPQEHAPSCILLDAWVAGAPGSKKILNDLANEYPDARIILFRTQDELNFRTEENISRYPRNFKILHLLAQPRAGIRSIVENYNQVANIYPDNDAVITKIITDLDTLNLHRTAANCVTLLRASERFYDDSPVNRTMLLEMVLRVLFDTGEVPTYQTRPDVKDCEHILGMFSEILIRRRTLNFSRDEFLETTKDFCRKNLLLVNCEILFDILFHSRIITDLGYEFSFKSSHWLMYFGARRMLNNSEFLEYVFSDRNYVNFPLIIEFYAGSDRRRDDAVDKLALDLKDARNTVETKTGLTGEWNPYHHMTWKPTDEDFDKLEELIGDQVKESNLPTSVKDSYADQTYDVTKPYHQGLGRLMEDYSVVVLMQSVRASARALRNSEYIQPDLKRALLAEISASMQTISKVVFAITPLLARDGYASIEGQGFNIIGEFGGDIGEKIQNILAHNAVNVVGWFSQDIFSPKMGPLFLEKMQNAETSIIKHHFALLVVSERPNSWRRAIERYMEEVKYDSFYLFDLVMSLQTQYKYAFLSNKSRQEVAILIKQCIAKHSFKRARPTTSDVKRISNSVLPDRSDE